jgi:phospholipid/cholesterol/gamma-HCH transport system ATP-binding protein
MQIFKLFLLFVGSVYGLLLLQLVFRSLFTSEVASAPEPEPQSDDCGETPYGLIEVINVAKAFDHPVLRGVTFRVHAGETLGVLGRSGTGKSVLLKLIAGFLKPDSGLILFEGRDITHMDEEELLDYRKRVSYVFQSGAVFDFLDVRGNVAFPLIERGVTDEEEIRKRVDYLLDAAELEGMADLRYDSLSVGARKQVAIARALAGDPEVVLYDEPTTGVDPMIGKSLSRLIRKLSEQEHLTSIVVTHDLRCLEIVSDRLLLLKDGVIHFLGTLEEFRRSEDPFVIAFRTGKRFVEEPEDEVLPA